MVHNVAPDRAGDFWQGGEASGWEFDGDWSDSLENTGIKLAQNETLPASPGRLLESGEVMQPTKTHSIAVEKGKRHSEIQYSTWLLRLDRQTSPFHTPPSSPSSFAATIRAHDEANPFTFAQTLVRDLCSIRHDAD